MIKEESNKSIEKTIDDYRKAKKSEERLLLIASFIGLILRISFTISVGTILILLIKFLIKL
ncbi:MULTISPECIES: hypothetical protein [Psychrilyobacter]|uniref:Uncharacterized protein n=1 Tax=Psychrilyobacter piezotolerans TaxID=2293438 RepID=A0ABX9KIQ1_9FUSO|nr:MULTISPECIES: hypothetical protein [Psychrilyobacter]MCS5420748.1 hypothetical protein [Psychrilyobacter sp. S5]NDI77460.1 hypothetical protein [Psychrilyobacter piezotolerans]RDE63760.1 hypothetical protein DV867_05125 [Psychrilyobacter sp. S5]REI42104.1 hypothetical protein DYH56_05125 [Psychrilyobacter piezotolerans]